MADGPTSIGDMIDASFLRQKSVVKGVATRLARRIDQVFRDSGAWHSVERVLIEHDGLVLRS